MKRILLASTAIVAFAGAAAAEVSFSGDAEIGHNDKEENGVYYSFGATLKASQELDNGLTAAFTGDVTFASEDSTARGDNVAIDDLVLSLTSDTAGLYYGDTQTAAEAHFSGVTNMQFDDFIEDGDVDDAASANASMADPVNGVLRGEMTFSGVTVAVSQLDMNSSKLGTHSGMEATQVVVKGDMGNVNFALAYQDKVAAGVTKLGATTVAAVPPATASTERYDAAKNSAASGAIFGLAVGTSLGGADLKLSYTSTDGAGDSTGVEVSYPVGDMKIGAFYVSNNPDAGTMDDNWGLSASYASGPVTVSGLYHGGHDEDMQINVTYDMGNGLNLFGGYRDEGNKDGTTTQQGKITYVGGDYDLGGGAKLRLSHVNVDRGTGNSLASVADEFGPGEDLKEGTTIEVSFKF